MVKALLQSKKFLVAVCGTLSAALLRLGWAVDSEAILAVISPLIAYILGQGLADKA